MDATSLVRLCESQFSVMNIRVFIAEYLHGCLLVNSRQVLEVLARIRNESKEALAERIFQNTMDMFFPGQPGA